jgi:pimeloyl-ACP methyl ester carboxylesterase
MITRTMATAAVLALGLLGAANAEAQDKPTILLVHGAFAESSSWNGVISLLARDGYTAIAVANPLRGVATDAAYVAAIVRATPGQVLLVGHSYGGTVISSAAANEPTVAGLVFVSAFAPDVGESSFELAGRFPGATLAATLAPPVSLPGGGVDLYIRQDRYWAQFAADTPEAEALLMAITQRPIAEAAGAEKASAAAWRSIPSWWIYGTADLNIPEQALAFMADRAGSRRTIAVVGASHVVMVSHPARVAALIQEAASATAAISGAAHAPHDQ